MTRQLMQLPGAGLVLALEGGYNERVIAECSAACVQVTAQPPTRPCDAAACSTCLGMSQNSFTEQWLSVHHTGQRCMPSGETKVNAELVRELVAMQPWHQQ